MSASRPPGQRRSGVVALLLALLGAGLAVGLVVVGAAPASAHAVLIGVRPAEGSSTATAPTTVTALFDDNIRTPSQVIVTGPSGTRVDHGRTAVVNNTASVPVTITQSGRYTMAYRVVSADGHPVSGQSTFTFTGGTSAPASPAASPSASPSAAPSAASSSGTGGGSSTPLLLAVLLVVLLVAVGGVVLARRRRQPRLRQTGTAAPDDPARDLQ